MRTARSRNSGEYLFDLLIALFSQEIESPVNPGRFTPISVECGVMVKYFLREIEIGEINGTNSCGDTPLYYAVLWNKPDVVKQLLLAGADVNKQCEFGVTPLYEAVSKNNVEMVKILLEAGASTIIKDDGGFTAVDVCKSENNRQIMELLNENP